MGLAITSCDKDNTDTETTETGTTPAGYVDLGLPSGKNGKQPMRQIPMTKTISILMMRR